MTNPEENQDDEKQDYGKGTFLIANPVLPDPNFSRTVVLLCNHDDNGSFGLVINRTADLKPADVFSNMESLQFYDNKIYIGGPVSQSQVFYLIRSSRPLPELEQVCDSVYLGMSWESLEPLLDKIPDPDSNIRFYMGYSGWGAGQLDGEMEQKSWLTCDARADFIFQEDENLIWAEVVRSLGKEYEYLIKAPVNPSLN